MINEVNGEILLTKAEATAHGVAPMDDFKNGLALSIKERWPALYKNFRHFYKTTGPKPGNIWTWAGVDHTRIVKTQTKHVNHAVREFRKEIEK